MGRPWRRASPGRHEIGVARDVAALPDGELVVGPEDVEGALMGLKEAVDAAADGADLALLFWGEDVGPIEVVVEDEDAAIAWDSDSSMRADLGNRG